jgi:type VI secretion system VasD/TssJ family lipoprotein
MMNTLKKKGMLRIWVKTLVGLMGVMLCLSACFWKSRQINLSVTGQAGMNSGGYAVLVCFYQLKSDVNFARVPLGSFWKEGQAAFQNDLVTSRTEKMLAPGDTEEIPLKISKETKFLGIAADFRKPDGDQWRKIYPLSKKRTKIIISVGNGGIELMK